MNWERGSAVKPVVESHECIDPFFCEGAIDSSTVNRISFEDVIYAVMYISYCLMCWRKELMCTDAVGLVVTCR